MANPTEDKRETERIDRWVRRKSIQGGWLVWCRLCGKSCTRSFVASMTDYAEAERASSEFAREHLGSASHKAALDAYFASELPPRLEQRRLLDEIFGGTPLSDDELRREAAKGAAHRQASEESRAEQRRKQEGQPKCALCGLAVTTKPEREDERLTLPSGALVHAKCVA